MGQFTRKIGAVVIDDPTDIIQRVLQSLEYDNAKKVEGDIVERLHARFATQPAPLRQAAIAFASVTSAEEFLGETLRLLGPYVRMLRDLYQLLRQIGATETGMAEHLRLDDAAMRRACRELPISEAFLRRLRETYLGWRVREIVSPRWERLSKLVIWDGQFYGAFENYPLLQVLTFAPALLARLRAEGCASAEAEQLEAAVEALIARLETIVWSVQHAGAAGALPDPLGDEEPATPEPPESPDGDAPLNLEALLSRIVSQDVGTAPTPDGDAPPNLEALSSGVYVTAIWDDLPGMTRGQTVAMSLAQARTGAFVPPDDTPRTHTMEGNTLAGLLVLVTIIRGQIIRSSPDAPISRNADLKARLEAALSSPGELTERVTRCVRALDTEIAPPAGTVLGGELLERVLELIDLPFWKERARLYEVWVLVRTASAVGAVPSLRAVARLGREGSTAVLHLPRSDAAQPIFDVEIDAPERRVVAWIWFQRRAKGAARGGTYEPDVRCTLSSPESSDLFIVECKDRMDLRRRRRSREHPEGEGYQDVAERYLDALRPRLLWLVNYSRFHEDMEPIRDSDGRGAWFAGEFHPGHVADAFDETIRGCLEVELAAVLPRLMPAPAPAEAIAPDVLFASAQPCAGRVELRWGLTPRDMDLYLWIEGWPAAVHYRDPGCGDAPPYAALNRDVKTGFGPEEIRIARLAPARYVVAVNNYSKEAEFAGCEAEITVELTPGRPLQVTVPVTGTGTWWHVLDIDGARGTMQVVNTLGAEPPWGRP